jgi:putative membrane protein
VIVWLLLSWATNALVLAVTTWVLSGVTNDGSTWTIIWAAAVFGILNTILKPIMRLITVPLALLTFGLAWFFVSMLMLWLTTLIISDFNVDGFWNYVWATIIIWLVNSVLDMIAFSMRRGNTARAAPA